VEASDSTSVERPIPAHTGPTARLACGPVCRRPIAVNCTAPQSPWSAVVVGDNGKFASVMPR